MATTESSIIFPEPGEMALSLKQQLAILPSTLLAEAAATAASQAAQSTGKASKRSKDRRSKSIGQQQKPVPVATPTLPPPPQILAISGSGSNSPVVPPAPTSNSESLIGDLINSVSSNPLACRTLRIAVLGLNGVGKTAFIVRFLTRRYIGTYSRGVEAKYRCNICIDNESVDLEILDATTPALVGSNSGNSPILGGYHQGQGQGGPTVYVKLYEDMVLHWADAFILVYSITSQKSFQIVSEMRRQIGELIARHYHAIDNGKMSPRCGGRGHSLAQHRAQPVIMLLGNKCDIEHLREVDGKLAEALAESPLQGNSMTTELSQSSAGTASALGSGLTVAYELSTASNPDDVQRCMYAFLRLAYLATMANSGNRPVPTPPVAMTPMIHHPVQNASKPVGQVAEASSTSNDGTTLNNAPISAINSIAATNSPVTSPTQTTSNASGGSKDKSASAKTFLLNKMFGGMLGTATSSSKQADKDKSKQSNPGGLSAAPLQMGGFFLE